MSIETRQHAAEQLLRRAGILPVITVHSIEQGQRIAEALLRGGLTTLELTLRTPAALDTLAALKRDWPEIVIGAGTIINPQQIHRAIDAGADFLVTPGTPPALADALADAAVPVVPGGATPGEFMALMARGFRVCKLFPASAVGGLAMLKGLAGPLAEMTFCPTGGISEATAADYLAQPNVLCIGGSWMLRQDWIDDGAWDTIQASARTAAQIVGACGQGIQN